MLLDNGADVNIPNIFGSTALHKAAYTDDIDSVTLLLERGANIHAKTVTKCTALNNAIREDISDEVISLLKNAYKNTPLSSSDREYMDSYNAAAIEFFGIEISTSGICTEFDVDF